MGVYESGASGKMGTRHVLQLDLSQQEEKKIPRWNPIRMWTKATAQTLRYAL